jgi:hypothetical protein
MTGRTISLFHLIGRIDLSGAGAGFAHTLGAFLRQPLSQRPERPPLEFFWFFLASLVLFVVVVYLLDLGVHGQDRTPDSCWKAGIFYVNREDPALFVPKRFGYGLTPNFAHPWSWVVLVVIVLASILPVVFTALTLHNLVRR